MLAEKLQVVESENSELHDKLKKTDDRHQKKLRETESKLNAILKNVDDLETESCQLKSTMATAEDEQKKNKKELKKLNQKNEELRSQCAELAAKICKYGSKSHKISERFYNISKDNTVLDIDLKCSVDSYNELKKELTSLEKDVLECKRSLG